jgi:hypothetical protein
VEFTKKIFGDLNRDILSNSNEEEEVHEEDAVDAEAAPSSVARAPALIASATDANEAPTGVQDDNCGDRTPDQKADGGINDGDEASSP